MNVGELINKLQKFDKTMKVMCLDKYDCDDECEWFEVSAIVPGTHSGKTVLFVIVLK